MNNFILNSDLGRIRYSLEKFFIPYSASEIREDATRKFSVIPNFIIKAENKPKFVELKEAFLKFKGLSQDNKIFGAGGFFEKANTALKEKICSGLPVFYSFEHYEGIKVLEGAEVIVMPALPFCVGSFKIAGTKQTSDVFTTCGHIQFVNPTVQYSASISSSLPMLEKNGFFRDAFNQIFSTLDYGFDAKPAEFSELQNEKFEFFINFQRLQGTEFANMLVSFRGQITNSEISRDASNAVSVTEIPLAVSGVVSVLEIPRNLEIFGDKEVTYQKTENEQEIGRKNQGQQQAQLAPKEQKIQGTISNSGS